MITLRKSAPVLIVIAMTAALAGCGGSDDAAPPPSPIETPATATLTKAELISEGNGICAEVNAAVGSIDGIEGIESSTRTSQKADLYAGLADRLAALGTPSDGDPPTDVIDAAEALGDATGGTDSDLDAFQQAATDFGLTECAEAPSAPTPVTIPDGGSDSGEGSDAGEGGEYTAPEYTAPPAETPAAPTPEGGGVSPEAPPAPGGGGGGTDGSGSGPGGSSGGIGPG